MGICDSNNNSNYHNIQNEKPSINSQKSGRINEKVLDSSQMTSIEKELYSVFPSICKIEIPNGKATGFLIKLNKGNKDFFCLLTNEHVIQNTMIESNEQITIYYNTESKHITIKLDPLERYINYNKDFDVTILEILPEDKINKDYFLLPYTDSDYLLVYRNICIPQFPRGEFSFSKGNIIKLDGNELTHTASTDQGSSGSPILLENTNIVVGIHKQGNKNKNIQENYGTLLSPIIVFLQKDNNRKQEKNKYFWENGEYYIGPILKGLPNGKGKKYFKDGRIFEGDFVYGKRVGNGKINNKNGEYYIGQYSNDIANGKGKYFINGRLMFEGDYVKGKREGNGTYIYENGEYYIGQWKNDNKNGKGKRFYKNGKIMYDGDFLNNYAHGKGKYYDENGNLLYDGEYVKDKREGLGKYIWEDGTYYFGQWSNNCRHGEGKIFSKDGEILQKGEFFNDEII